MLSLFLLALLAAAPVRAQVPASCSVTAVPTPVRAEGQTELVGDIVLTCTGGARTPAGQTIPQANIAVALNANVTSRILSNGASEALVLIDEPGSTGNPQQRTCTSINGCAVTGTAGAGTPFDGSSASRPNIFQGVVTGNVVNFLGVPIEPAGATGVRTYRITNVRTNASALFSGTSPGPLVVASVSVSGSTSLPLSNPVVPVGTVVSSMTFGSGGINATTCAALDRNRQFAALLFTENYSTAFQTRTVAGADPDGTAAQRTPGTDYFAESGFIPPDLAGAGLASFGTRLKAVFQKIPAGVTVWVTTTNIGVTPTNSAQLVSSETGPYFALTSTITIQGLDAIQLPVAGGRATAVWEVTGANPVSTDSLFFAVFFESAAPIDPNSPATTVNGSYAPTYPAATGGTAQAAGIPIPRFADTSTPVNVISVSPCQTVLLFPFVVSSGGFDTGLAISNTSRDPVGTDPRDGVCTLNAFGDTIPPVVTTPKVAAGSTYTTLASTAFPDFLGYVFAVCDFRYAHGFAFVSDAGARNLAMGYLALVTQDNTFETVVRSGAPSGESKSH